MSKTNSTITAFLQNIIFSLFNLIIFLTPFIFTWVNQELFEFNKMIFVYGMTILIVTLWGARMIIEKKFIFKRSKLDYFLLAFFVSQLLSTIFSMHQRTSFFGYYSRFNGGLLSIISYLLLFYAFVSNIEKKQINVIIDSLLVSAFLVSLYAIPEHFGHSPSCFLITQKFDVACWKQKVQERVFASFGQPNWLAAYLAAVIPLNLNFLVKKDNSNGRKIFLWLNLILMTTALFFTQSRSAILALAIALIFFAAVKIVSSPKKLQKKLFAKFSLAATIMAFLLLLIGTPYTPNLKELINKNQAVSENHNTQIESEENNIETGGSASSEIRKVVWQGAFKVWQRHPILGSGVETFAYSYYLDRPIEHNLLSEWDFLYNKAHNEILNYMATTGLLGTLSYLAIFTCFFWLVFKELKNKNNENGLAIAAAIIAIFISNFFGFSTVMINLLMFSYWAIFSLETTKDSQEKDEKTLLIENIKNWQIISMLLLTLTGLLGLKKVYNIWRADYLFTQGSNYFTQGNYQNGIGLIQEAIEMSPKEALFYDSLASNYSSLAVSLAEQNEATAATQLAQAAIQSNNYALELNPVHLNFYKSKARIFIRLGQIDRDFYYYAQEALEQAIQLAPSDAKLYYNLGLIKSVLGDPEAALGLMLYSVKIKANYSEARNELARIYYQQGKLAEAKNEYQYILENINPEDELVKSKLEVIEASMGAKVK
jgi:O-antigen ligase/Flp pilus assembly protein TadD